MFTLEYLGDLYYRKTSNYSGLLFGGKSLEEIRHKKIIVMGTGETSFFCSTLLKSIDIEVYAYCENYKPLVGQRFLSKDILSSYEILRLKNNDVHLITAIHPRHTKDILNQLIAYGVENYSIFTIQNLCYLDNIEYRELMVEAINATINSSYKDVFGLCGGMEWLVGATDHLCHVFDLLCNESKDITEKLDVLEIGAGTGVLSYMIKKTKPNLNIDWISYSKEKSGPELAYIDKLNNKYPVNIYYGLVEDPKYLIDKTYDMIIMTEVLEHFTFHPIETLKKVTNALRKDGRFYFSTPDWEHLYTYETWKDIPGFSGTDVVNQYPFGHCYQYSQEELYEIFEICGLKVEKYLLTPGKRQVYILIRSACTVV